MVLDLVLWVRLDCSGCPVWVLNVDTLTPEIHARLGWALHGYGETFFFNHGVQVDSQLHLAGDYAASFAAKWQASFA